MTNSYFYKIFWRINVEKEDRKTLLHISSTLDEILMVIKKPENKIIRIINIGAAIMSIMGIVFIIEMILGWIFGGD